MQSDAPLVLEYSHTNQYYGAEYLLMMQVRSIKLPVPPLHRLTVDFLLTIQELH